MGPEAAFVSQQRFQPWARASDPLLWWVAVYVTGSLAASPYQLLRRQWNRPFYITKCSLGAKSPWLGTTEFQYGGWIQRCSVFRNIITCTITNLKCSNMIYLLYCKFYIHRLVKTGVWNLFLAPHIRNLSLEFQHSLWEKWSKKLQALLKGPAGWCWWCVLFGGR